MATLDRRGIDGRGYVGAVHRVTVSGRRSRRRTSRPLPARTRRRFKPSSALLPVPFLQACNRRWASSISESWVEGYCPVCGSWPAFAEVRGIERSRYFRCGRCGGEWHARALCVPVTARRAIMTSSSALVPEKAGSNAPSSTRAGAASVTSRRSPGFRAARRHGHARRSCQRRSRCRRARAGVHASGGRRISARGHGDRSRRNATLPRMEP